jgi:CRP-like cAMP-binding protein
MLRARGRPAQQRTTSAVAGLPQDPQVWADALFRDPPRWVAAALGLRERLVGLVGIDRGGPASFDTVVRSDDEVLLGTDEQHLDFRAGVFREVDRVVLTTVVQLHNRRGRAYFALVRLVHPSIVRAMMNRATRRLSRSSRTRTVDATTTAQ